MPHSSDDPSSDRISAEAPSAQPAEGQESEPTSPSQPATLAEDASIASDPQDLTAGRRRPPRLPRRRRRRRRPPRAADPAAATAAPQGQAEEPATAADAAQSDDLRAAPPPEGEPRRRRRRRRGQRRDAGSAEVKAGEAAQAAESAPGVRPSFTRPDNDPAQNGASPGGPPSDREPREGQPHEQPRRRRRRRRPPHPAGASATEATKIVAASAAEGTPAGAPRHQSAPYRGSRSRGARNRGSGDERPPERGPVGDSPRPSDRRARGKGPSSRDDRRQGRDRDAPRKKPEQRLYALEAVVDRGFEDVVDAAEGNLTRRIHWTIVKRTVADQESGKPISATYVLKRDGVDTEFPGLGAARAAVNKTIVHPEKLTLSKAEHAAEHAATKK
jgi:hypothetical protein